MKIAFCGKIPSSHWIHNPIYVDNVFKRTVAMRLAKNGIVPPKEW